MFVSIFSMAFRSFVVGPLLDRRQALPRPLVPWESVFTRPWVGKSTRPYVISVGWLVRGSCSCEGAGTKTMAVPVAMRVGPTNDCTYIYALRLEEFQSWGPSSSVVDRQNLWPASNFGFWWCSWRRDKKNSTSGLSSSNNFLFKKKIL